jgi:hypothetical protein
MEVGHDLQIPAFLSIGKMPRYCVDRRLGISIIDVFAMNE